MTRFEIEINAGVDADDDQHALILVALDLLEAAYTGDDGRVREFGPRAPAGYVAYVDFKLDATALEGAADALELADRQHRIGAEEQATT